MTSRRRTLILLRHAKSDWSGDERDLHRPLVERGRRQAPDAGAWLAENADAIDLAVVSSATRAQQTWQLVSAALAVPPPMRTEERAYAATAGELLDLVRELPAEVGTAVIVGHNPGLEDLATMLTGRSVEMPTSALAVIWWAEEWESAGAVDADLVASGRPPS
jgi:phosphohistidine phosphatase